MTILMDYADELIKNGKNKEFVYDYIRRHNSYLTETYNIDNDSLIVVFGILCKKLGHEELFQTYRKVTDLSSVFLCDIDEKTTNEIIEFYTKHGTMKTAAKFNCKKWKILKLFRLKNFKVKKK